MECIKELKTEIRKLSEKIKEIREKKRERRECKDGIYSSLALSSRIRQS